MTRQVVNQIKQNLIKSIELSHKLINFFISECKWRQRCDYLSISRNIGVEWSPQLETQYCCGGGLKCCIKCGQRLASMASLASSVHQMPRNITLIWFCLQISWSQWKHCMDYIIECKIIDPIERDLNSCFLLYWRIFPIIDDIYHHILS